MTDLILRLLKIHKGEGIKVLQFTLLSALLQAGLAIGMSTSDSLFLTHIGARKLPFIYLITPVMMLVYTSMFSYLMNKYGLIRLFYITLAVLSVGGIVFYFCLKPISGMEGSDSIATGHPIIYYAAKLYSSLWYIALYTLFWNFTDSYFDILDAKRLFSIFNGGGATGAMLGGALVSFFSKYLPVAGLYLVWVVLSLATLPVLLRLRQRWKTISATEDDTATPFVQQVRETVGLVRWSSFVRLLLLVLFSALILTTLMEYQYMTIFSQDKTEAQLAALFGQLFVIVNGFNLLINFFLFNRMVLRIGVGNVTLIGPIANLIAFTFLLLAYGKYAAFFAFFVYQGIFTTIDWNNVNFLYNAVPPKAKDQVRTFTEGLCEPLATATAGVFLWIWATDSTPKWLKVTKLSAENISACGIIGAAIYLILTIFLRSSYAQSMVVNLKQTWLDFSKPEESLLKDLDTEEVSFLKAKTQSDNPETILTAISILWQNDRLAALDALITHLENSREYERVWAQPLLETMLEAEDYEVIRRILDWLDLKSDVLGPTLLEALADHGLIQSQDVASLLISQDPKDRAAAVVAFWNSWSTADRLQALEVVNTLLKGTQPEIISGVRALGRTKQERHAHFLEPYLDDASPDVRKEALAAVHRLVNTNSSRLLPAILGAIELGDTEERILAMDALTKIGDTNTIMPLLALSDSFTPFERRKAEKVLLSIGLKSVPTTVSVVRDPQYPYKARSIAARALSKLAFPQLESISPALIHIEIERAYQFLYFRHVLAQDPRAITGVGLGVLSRFYQDMQTVIVDFVLEMLSVGGRLPDFELISASLRSENKKERANAIETIEQGVSRDIFKVLQPLIDRTYTQSEIISFYQARYSPRKMTPTEIITVALQSSLPLECSAAAQALWEASHADPDQSRSTDEILRMRMREVTIPLFRETALSLLARREDDVILNLIEKISAIAHVSYFEAFTAQDLEAVARSASLVTFGAGTRIFCAFDSAETLYVILSGHVELTTPEGSLLVTKGPGEIFGEESALGQIQRTEEAVSQGLEALSIPASTLGRASRTYARIAIGLLTNKLNLHSALETHTEIGAADGS